MLPGSVCSAGEAPGGGVRAGNPSAGACARPSARIALSAASVGSFHVLDSASKKGTTSAERAKAQCEWQGFRCGAATVCVEP